MIASMFNLEHRVNELRPTDRDQQLARERRTAGSRPRTVVGSIGAYAATRLASIWTSRQPSRVAG